MRGLLNLEDASTRDVPIVEDDPGRGLIGQFRTGLLPEKFLGCPDNCLLRKKPESDGMPHRSDAGSVKDDCSIMHLDLLDCLSLPIRNI
jgi:hypothetical protein